MTPPFAFFRRQSIRLRITLTFVVTGLLLAMLISVGTFFAVRSLLIDQRIESSQRQTVFVLLFAREFFTADPTDPEDLVALLQARGEFQAMVIQSDEFFSTTLPLTPETIPPGLISLVASERIGYQFTRLEDENALAYGAPLPSPKTDLYLIYPIDDIDRTLSVLLRALIVTGAAVVTAAAIVALRVGARIIRPLADVSNAARRVAEGLLETRVAPSSPDELGLLAASFNQMAAAFQEMLDRERRFVANVSHELRTPIATLRAAGELLVSHRERFGPAEQEAVDLIAEDVESLQHLVEELMEVSQTDAGGTSMRWEELDLRAVAEATVRRARRDAPVEGEPTPVVADKVRLERILSNLIDNAYEHGHGRDVRLAVASDGSWCTVRVTDRGPGIARTDLPHLFDRFYKADHSRARDRGGAGLGLAIAMENARLHAGTITATGTPEGGAVFTLRVPRRPPEREEA